LPQQVAKCDSYVDEQKRHPRITSALFKPQPRGLKWNDGQPPASGHRVQPHPPRCSRCRFCSARLILSSATRQVSRCCRTHAARSRRSCRTCSTPFPPPSWPVSGARASVSASPSPGLLAVTGLLMIALGDKDANPSPAASACEIQPCRAATCNKARRKLMNSPKARHRHPHE
jgi:hypothetical protein